MKKLPASPVSLLALPALSAREAEALIDLLGQIQGALWDTYADAIGHSDGEKTIPSAAASATADDNDDSSAF